jgi:lambda family phage tail tape measure protein
MKDELDEARGSAEALRDVFDDLETRSRSFGTAITSALKGAVIEGDNLTDVLQSIGYKFSSIALSSGLKPLETTLSSAIGGLTSAVGQAFGYAQGGVPGRVQAFASGGIVNAPTIFPLGGATGLMGEAGAEAILPLRRGADGRLGVATGSGGGGMQVVFNVQAQDAQSFRKSEAQISAMLTRAVGRGRRSV